MSALLVPVQVIFHHMGSHHSRVAPGWLPLEKAEAAGPFEGYVQNWHFIAFNPILLTKAGREASTGSRGMWKELNARVACMYREEELVVAICVVLP